MQNELLCDLATIRLNTTRSVELLSVANAERISCVFVALRITNPPGQRSLGCLSDDVHDISKQPLLVLRLSRVGLNLKFVSRKVFTT